MRWTLHIESVTFVMRKSNWRRSRTSTTFFV